MTATLAVVLAAVLLAGCAAEPRPEIDYEPGEISGTDPAFGQKMADCLGDAGWEVQVDVDGSFGADVPEAQMDAYDAASDTCMSELGFDVPPPVLTEAERKRLYSAKLALVGCLEGEGHTISDVPSEQAYLDDALFDPYGELRSPGTPNSLTDEEYAELIKKCPAP